MTEYKLIDLHDKENCLLLSVSGGKYYLFCDNQNEAHSYKLGLMLETLPSPAEAPELYESVELSGYENVLKPKSLAFNSHEEDDFDSCCQSGCAGCPHYKGLRS
ncbi:hypothetical protein [Bacteriovorax sp. Seq25_V]|uniref:hypothetical protein n=1 Tax=Bacteriovorax sp. Seq25_V TaxID=1201288 RepID=UPI000389F50A|nr:hypothetical protein [Bacteriovorax sp. Seq25_V]EQC45485.1 hypothetical protein M900_1930 [Bacteriovorax sp. Seq25_V]